MKKNVLKSLLLSAMAFFCSSSLFSAEFEGDLLSKPFRIFELGIDANAAFANSNFMLKDILKKNLVFDLKKIASDVPEDGFSLGLYNKESVFINLNLSSRFRFSLFTNVETIGRFNIGKDMFDILADGLSVGESRTSDVDGAAESYICIGSSFQTIIKDIGIKFTPTYFAPIFYIPKTTATASVKSDSSGAIRAEAEANIDIYTALDMHDFIENGRHFDDLNLSAGRLLSHGGFDFSIEAERNWLESLNAGLYTRIPMVAGTLKHKMSTRVWAYFYETNALGYLNDTEEHGSDYGHDDFTYSNESRDIHRPFKLGLNATYMPFGDWFKIKPAIGFAVRNPYSAEATFYPEYALDFRLSVVKHIFNFNLGTAYQNQLFQQRFGFSFNFRAIEIMAQASWCGTTFVSSFKRDGYGAFVGLRFGW